MANDRVSPHEGEREALAVECKRLAYLMARQDADAATDDHAGFRRQTLERAKETARAFEAAIDRLAALSAQPAAEPVAWRYRYSQRGKWQFADGPAMQWAADHSGFEEEPLYTHPPSPVQEGQAPQGLTDEQMLAAFDEYAREQVHSSCRHHMRPENWPNHWPWFEAGWRAAIERALQSQTKETP